MDSAPRHSRRFGRPNHGADSSGVIAMSVIGHNHIRKVENFDGYEVLAHPLAHRDDRIFHRGEPETSRVSVTYASHDVQIARPRGIGSKGRIAILMHSGLGRRVLEFYESALPI